MNKLDKIKKLVGHGFKLFALAPNKKIPAFQNWQALATSDLNLLLNAYDKVPNLNIGISTGSTFLAVDCDMKDGVDGIKDIEALEAIHGKLPETFMQFTPSGGVHYIFRTQIAVANSVKKIAPGIDIRGVGGLVVASGSTIDGKEYTDNDKPVAVAPLWLIEQCQKAQEKMRGSSTFEQELDKEILKNVSDNAQLLEEVLKKGEEFLTTLPEASSGSRNNAAYMAAAKLHDYGIPERDAVDLMVEHFKADPPISRHEVTLTVRNAYKYSRNFAASGIDSAHSLNSMLDNMNSHYGYIYHGKKEYVLHKQPNGETIWYTLQAFNNNISTMVDVDGKKKKLSKIWLEWEKRGQIQKLVSEPWPLGENPTPLNNEKKEFNLWTGWDNEVAHRVVGASKKHLAVEMWRDHLYKNVANGVEEHAIWIENWFANILQKPRQKPGTALVIRGNQGAGKNTIFETFGYSILAKNFGVVAHPRYLVGNFNSIQEGKLLMLLDEAFWSGAHDAASVLKALVTEQTVMIERKGFEPYAVESNVRVGVIGNANWMIDVPVNDRRFAVFTIGEGRLRDREYFGALHRACADAEGAAALGRHLLDVDLKRMDVGHAPITEGKRFQMTQSFSIAQDWWSDSVDSGAILGAAQFEEHSDWKSKGLRINIDRAYQMISSYASTRNIRSRVPKNEALIEELKQLCPALTIHRNMGYRYLVAPPWHVCVGDLQKVLGDRGAIEEEEV